MQLKERHRYVLTARLLIPITIYKIIERIIEITLSIALLQAFRGSEIDGVIVVNAMSLQFHADGTGGRILSSGQECILISAIV